MTSILVPIDFSANAENALRYAIGLADKVEVKIILLHSFHIDYANAYVSVDIIEKQVEMAKVASNQKLKAVYSSLSHHSDSIVEYISSQNLLLDEILRVVEEKKIDLIVMGTNGVNEELSRQIFGTNSSKVIEKATCPVIVVPKDVEPHEIKTMVYATEFLDSDIACLQSLSSIAKLSEACIHIIHVSIYYEDESEKRLMENFKQKVEKTISYKNLFFKIITGSYVERRIETYLEEVKADMLVMSAHHRSLLDRLVGKSIAKEITLHLKTPLMVFHHRKNTSKNDVDHTAAKLIL